MYHGSHSNPNGKRLPKDVNYPFVGAGVGAAVGAGVGAAVGAGVGAGVGAVVFGAGVLN